MEEQGHMDVNSRQFDSGLYALNRGPVLPPNHRQKCLKKQFLGNSQAFKRALDFKMVWEFEHISDDWENFNALKMLCNSCLSDQSSQEKSLSQYLFKPLSRFTVEDENIEQLPILPKIK